MITIPEIENVLLFLTAASLLIVVPGPAVLYIMTKSLEQGNRAGFVSVLGVGIGGLVHVMAASVGLSALLVASVTAFSVVKYLGAFYLIFLGVKKLVHKRSFKKEGLSVQKKSLSGIFCEGILVNIFNPKTAIFFLAFLPQFVSVEKGGITSQLLVLGLLFVFLAVLSDSLYVLLSGKLAFWLHSSTLYKKTHNYLMAGIYIFLGLATFFVNSPTTTRK